VLRVTDVLPATASDAQVVAQAQRNDRIILTQDLDFSDIVALSGAERPSLVILRLASSGWRPPGLSTSMPSWNRCCPPSRATWGPARS
jgi:hypothetical protein